MDTLTLSNAATQKKHTMKNTLFEWIIETLNENDVRCGCEDPDIEDTNYSEKLDFKPLGKFERLALVGRIERYSNSYAYPVDGILPDRFHDGHKVPKRFQAELTKWLAAQECQIPACK